MQLRARARRRPRARRWLKRWFAVLATKTLALVTAVAFVSTVRADAAQINAYNTTFYEWGGPLNMLIVNPKANFRLTPVRELTFRGGWEADVVSGASVAVVDAPSTSVDAISSATQVHDFRNVFSGTAELHSDYGTLRGGYSHGMENDYRSDSFTLGARTDLLDRTATIDLSYARGFDQVCDVVQQHPQDPAHRQRLDSSIGCFTNAANRMIHSVNMQTFQGSWTQAWAPIFVTQLTVSGQLVDGFQSNPYRAVWLGRSAAQEHHPDHRFRYSAALSGRLWIEPLNAALQAVVRLYRDNWNVRSVTAELAYEQTIDGSLRLRVHGRFYDQGAAAFYSDDYATQPRGQYFTGDRELSDMQSYMAGAQLVWTLTAGTEGASLGFLESFRLVLRADYLHQVFPDFHYGHVSVPNNNSVMGTLGLEMVF